MLGLAEEPDEGEAFLLMMEDKVPATGTTGFGIGSGLDSCRGSDGRGRSDVLGDTKSDDVDELAGGMVNSWGSDRFEGDEMGSISASFDWGERDATEPVREWSSWLGKARGDDGIGV